MASISLHFVTLLKGTGDVGALNAKDARKETVLALLGILLQGFYQLAFRYTAQRYG